MLRSASNAGATAPERGASGAAETIRQVENGRLLAIEDLTLENDLADIEAIAQQVRQRPAGAERALRDSSDIVVLVTGSLTHEVEEAWSNFLFEALKTAPDRMAARLTSRTARNGNISCACPIGPWPTPSGC
jgi:hypothetical protein